MEAKVICPHCGQEHAVEVIVDTAKIIAVLRALKKRRDALGIA